MFEWIKTCNMCPEQYDIYCNGELLAYFRIRYGKLYVHLYKHDTAEKDDEPYIDWENDVYFYQYEDSYKGYLEDNEFIEHKNKIENILNNYVGIQ